MKEKTLVSLRVTQGCCAPCMKKETPLCVIPNECEESPRSVNREILHSRWSFRMT